MNPGLCKTELAREQDSWMFWIILTFIARTAEMGSRTLVHAALGADGEGFKGEYLSDCTVDKYYLYQEWTDFSVSAFVTSEEGKKTQTKLWGEMMEILGKVAPEVGRLF